MERLKKYLFNTLIVSYLAIVYFSGMPETNVFDSRLKAKAMSIAFALGIWPSWSMFAPNPIRFDSKTYVLLKYKSGEYKEVDVEKKLDGLLATFRSARWMKYAQDNLRNLNQKALLKPVARYFVRKYDRKDDPLVVIQILRRWNEIQPFSYKKLYSIFETPRIQKQEILLSESIAR